MHAVRELHHDDADVAHHGKQHLAEALGLRFLAVLELDLVELAHAVDEFRDHLAEYRGDLGFGRRGILDNVVEDGRNQRVGIQLEVCQDVGDRHRMGDVGLAGGALLALMPLGAEVVSLAYPLHLPGRQVGLELV